jgi:RNA polymerase subunit RPABC4/transcription elongation factor Spt4
MQTLIIKLTGHEILLKFGNKGSAAISSDLKELCPHCQDSECYFTCEKSQVIPDCQFSEIAKEEEDEKVQSRHVWNSAMDAIESLILAHACAGINVCGKGYIKGIEQAIEGLSNHHH